MKNEASRMITLSPSPIADLFRQILQFIKNL